MLDKLKKSLREASDLLREQAANLGEGAREKSYQIIEDWLTVFPTLESFGLAITSFGLSVAISPALEVEMKGVHADFTPERLRTLSEAHRNSAMISSVLSTIKTTYALHRRIHAGLHDPLIVKIRIRISPEIKVFIGEPIVQ